MAFFGRLADNIGLTCDPATEKISAFIGNLER